MKKILLISVLAFSFVIVLGRKLPEISTKESSTVDAAVTFNPVNKETTVVVKSKKAATVSPTKKDPPRTNITKSNDRPGYIRSDETYILEDTAGVPCVLAYFKAKITIYYPIKKGEDKYESVITYPPSDVAVSGTCDRDNLVAVLKLTWDDGVFILTFRYDDLTDSWYVSKFGFKFDTSSSKFKNAREDKTVLVESSPKRRFWATSHARSFRCLLLHDVSLVDDDEKYSATVHFDEARVQALTRSANFKTPKHCIHRVHRDEMVPATVGGLLAASAVLTICGYAVFRYFKVKKFQYDTME